MSEENSEEEKTVTESESDEPNKIKVRPLTKFEQDMMLKARERHRANITKEQKCWGKVFKGDSFIAKPDKILFKDFEIGKVYSQTIELTNVSFTFCSYKLLPLDTDIKDLFEITYVPPGRMSAGITSNITITFTPQLNQDIISVFPILSETGPINIPLHCLCQKSVISVDQPIIDFGNVILGEYKQIILKIPNDGALHTSFMLRDKNGEVFQNYAEMTFAGSQSDGAASQASLADSNVLDKDFSISNLSSFEQFLFQSKFHRNGELHGYSTHNLALKFTPSQLESYDEEILMMFTNKLLNPITLRLRATGTDVPIYSELSVYNFNVCVIDHSYREKIILHNRSTGPMKIQLTCPKDIKQHIEFNPTLGYIQGSSTFDIWVKFRPDANTNIQFSKYMVHDNVFNVPIKIIGAGQVVPVSIELHAELTTDNVVFNPPQLDFGLVYVENAYKAKFQVINQSALPQDYSFVRLPPAVSIMPNNGFGTLLPYETVEMYAVYNPLPVKPGTELTDDIGNIYFRVKTGTICAKEFKLPYTTNLKFAPIKFTSSKLEFPSTPVGEETEFITTLVNSSMKQAYAIEIVPPDPAISGLTITPIVLKRFAPDQSQKIVVKFNSEFRDLEEPKKVEVEEKEEEKVQVGRGGRQAAKAAPAKRGAKIQEADIEESMEKSATMDKTMEEDPWEKNNELWKMGGKVHDFYPDEHDKRCQIYEWLVPVYFKAETGSGEEKLNRAFLEIRTCVLNRSLSSNVAEIDFGELAVSSRLCKEITITNVGTEPAPMRLDPLPPYGGFAVLNAMRTIEPGKSKNVVVEFEPNNQQMFEEVLTLRSHSSIVSIKLKGRGIKPEAKVTPEDGLLHVGNCVMNDTLEKTFTIKNISRFPFHFTIQRLLTGDKNYNGLINFVYIPKEGDIQPNEEATVAVRFNPDHYATGYYEHILVDVPNQIDPKELYVKGMCWTRSMWVKMYEDFLWPKNYDNSFDTFGFISQQSKKIVINLEFLKDDGNVDKADKHLCTRRSISLGNCKMNDAKNDKPGQFEINIPRAEYNVFTCLNPKGTVGPGQELKIDFNFAAPPDDPLLAELEVLQGIGQWVEVVCEGRINGGYIAPNENDNLLFDVVLKAYIRQI